MNYKKNILVIGLAVAGVTIMISSFGFTSESVKNEDTSEKN